MRKLKSFVIGLMLFSLGVYADNNWLVYEMESTSYYSPSEYHDKEVNDFAEGVKKSIVKKLLEKTAKTDSNSIKMEEVNDFITEVIDIVNDSDFTNNEIIDEVISNIKDFSNENGISFKKNEFIQMFYLLPNFEHYRWKIIEWSSSTNRTWEEVLDLVSKIKPDLNWKENLEFISKIETLGNLLIDIRKLKAENAKGRAENAKLKEKNAQLDKKLNY